VAAIAGLAMGCYVLDPQRDQIAAPDRPKTGVIDLMLLIYRRDCFGMVAVLTTRFSNKLGVSKV
jgi:hypothetical protein